MAGKQDTLIYIEQDNKTEAEFMSRSFVNGAVKNRAYINALGAELVMKYLASEEINVSETHNLHSISKILEKIDISDILLPNIHIDVRVVFDENQIFIPKSHFQLEITPDIYVVLKLAKDFSHVEFLGYFEPKLLNLKLKNSEYYFFEKEKLSSPAALKQFIQKFPGNTSRGISEKDMLRGRELSIAMADHNIADEEQKELIELLLLSSELRESVLEFDNFETLSYSVGSSFSNSKTTSTEVIDAEIIQNDAEEDNSNQDNNEQEEPNEELNLTDTEDEVILDESFFDLEEASLEENAQTLETSTEEDEAESNTTLDIQTEEEEQIALDTEGFTTTEENIEPLISDMESSELVIEENLQIDEFDSTDETTQDETATQEENSLDETPKTEEKAETEVKAESDPLEKAIGDAIQKVIEKSAETAAGAAGLAGTVAAGEALAAGGASQDAMKLAGVSGELVNDIINKNLESQQEHLNKIDYSQISTNATEVPEHLAAYDLSVAKIEADIEAEASGQFDSPKDLSELKTVETKQTLGEEEIFEPETIDLGAMETVETEDIFENNDSVVDLDNLNTIESPTTPVENFEEKIQENTAEDHLSDIDFSSMSSITINADGSSPIDDIDINFDNNEEDKHLVDFGTNSNEIIIDDMPIQDISTATNESLEADLMLDDNFGEDFTETPTPAEENMLSNTGEEETILTETKEDEEETIGDLTINEGFEENLTLDDSSISIDEDINLTTETTIENLTPVLEEETLETNIEDNVYLKEENTVENVIVDEYINTDNEPVIDTIETVLPQTETLEEVSADILLDNVIDNIEDNTAEESTPVNTQDRIIYEDDDEPVQNINEFGQSEFNELQQPEDIITIENSDFDNENIPTAAMPDSFETKIPETEIDNNLVDNNENQDWMEANYDNLQDVEIPTPADVSMDDTQNILDELSPEEFITEPDENNAKVYTVVENSTVISDMNFKTGEIPIDINENPELQLDGPEQLESLYNPDNTVPGAALLQNPGRLGSASKGNSKLGLGLGLGIIGIILSIVIVGIIGFSVSKMLNKQTEETPQPITDDMVPTSPDNGVSDANTLNVDQNNVINMDNTTNNTPALPAAKPVTPKPPVTQQSTALQQTTQQQNKARSATSFIEISKLTWGIPDYISYNQQFKQYFQAVGKSLKLSLNSDLLLATDYAYSDHVKIAITYAKDGTYKDTKIITSSGSTQIDNIVLQTVNQTLKVLKAPPTVGNDDSITVTLKIYF